MKLLGLSVIVLSIFVPMLQLFSLPNIGDKIALFSQYLGMVALILMAWGQIMSTRMRGIETLFGGLDQVYVLHKWAGITALGAILLHDTIDAEIRGLGAETLLTELAETLGELSLYALLILAVLSIATFVPYGLWKLTHKFMGAFFTASVFHFVFILKPFSMTDPIGLYTGLFCLAGLLAYVWTLLPDGMRGAIHYKITHIEDQAGSTAITMAPVGRAIKPRPGQFGIFQFEDIGSTEPHPFSFSKIYDNGQLRITIKGLGDYTSKIGGQVKLGGHVNIQGPYGRFTLRENAPQIWIAGGIGITPFLTWAEALGPDAPKVDLFYSVRSTVEAPHLAELQHIARTKPNFHLIVVETAHGERLSADTIVASVGQDLSAYFVAYCGPKGLRHALQRGLTMHGVSSRRFHYEEFEFRRGIGLRKLLAWAIHQVQNIANRSEKNTLKNRTEA